MSSKRKKPNHLDSLTGFRRLTGALPSGLDRQVEIPFVESLVNKNQRQQSLEDELKEQAQVLRRLEWAIEEAKASGASLTEKTEDAIKQIDFNSNKRIEKFDNELSLQKQALVTNIDNLKDGLAKDRYRTVEVLALFVAFFTFVSVEFQLFANLTDFWQVIELSLILFGMVIFFVILLSRVINRTENEEPKRNLFQGNKLLITSICFVIAGVAMAIIGAFTQNFGSKQDAFLNQKATNCIQLMNSIKNYKVADYEQKANTYYSLRCDELGLIKDQDEDNK